MSLPPKAQEEAERMVFSLGIALGAGLAALFGWWLVILVAVLLAIYHFIVAVRVD